MFLFSTLLLKEISPRSQVFFLAVCFLGSFNHWLQLTAFSCPFLSSPPTQDIWEDSALSHLAWKTTEMKNERHVWGQNVLELQCSASPENLKPRSLVWVQLAHFNPPFPALGPRGDRDKTVAGFILPEKRSSMVAALSTLHHCMSSTVGE